MEENTFNTFKHIFGRNSTYPPIISSGWFTEEEAEGRL